MKQNERIFAIEVGHGLNIKATKVYFEN